MKISFAYSIEYYYLYIMKIHKTTIVLIGLLLYQGVLWAQTTFTSTQNGIWDDGATWGNTSPGTAGTDYPGRTDHAIIGHTVTVNANNDNGSTGVTPTSLTDVCDPTNVDGCTNAAFYQTGQITVNNGGTFSSTVNVMIGDTVTVNNGGTFNVASGNLRDLFILSFFELNSGSSLLVDENLVISLSGVIFINSGATTEVRDDAVLDGDNAFICGDGNLNIDNTNSAGEDNGIQLINNTDPNTLDQICEETTVTCTDGDCCESNCTADLDAAAGAGDGQVSPSEGTADSSAVLPIELAYFRTSTNSNEIILHWATYAEIDNDFFSIQKSIDMRNWESIAQIDGQGNANEVHEYSFIDTYPVKGTSYYRIKQTDFDGRFSYTHVVLVNIGVQSFSLFPNPSNGVFTILSSDEIDIEDVSIFDVAGNETPFQYTVQDTEIAIDLGAVYKGLYFVSIMQASEHVVKKLVVK